jgi:hypothetical protein
MGDTRPQLPSALRKACGFTPKTCTKTGQKVGSPSLPDDFSIGSRTAAGLGNPPGSAGIWDNRHRSTVRGARTACHIGVTAPPGATSRPHLPVAGLYSGVPSVQSECFARAPRGVVYVHVLAGGLTRLEASCVGRITLSANAHAMWLTSLSPPPGAGAAGAGRRSLGRFCLLPEPRFAGRARPGVRGNEADDVG